MCLDIKDLNNTIIHGNYKVPTLDKITYKLSGTSVFSKLNASNGFWSIQMGRNQITDQMPIVIAIYDDICVFGQTCTSPCT